MKNSKSLIGQNFGKWTVLKKVENYKNGNARYLCKCECGKESEVNAHSLLYGKSKSCGCHFINDLSGERFGKLLVLRRVENSKNGSAQFLCRCDCGNEVSVKATDLRGGKVMSCGCYKLQCKTKHLLCGSRLYLVWASMKRRCDNLNNSNSKNYGQRGIVVCEEWSGENGFQNFYDWAMSNGYNPEAKRGECTIDRIDVNGNYCPENCRWVDMKTQCNNTRRNRVICYEGETLTISQIAKKYKLKTATLFYHLRKGNDMVAVIDRLRAKNSLVEELRK